MSGFQTQLRSMLILQDKMNTKVHPEWRAQGFAWHRAGWTECGELMDHYGWKWWKKQEPNMAQVKLEIVDIWHFGLSMLLLDKSFDNIEDLVAYINKIWFESDLFKDNVLLNTEKLANAFLCNIFGVRCFRDLMISVGMTFDELYRQYVAKNVLNFFRQDHGYKTGEYRKIWVFPSSESREDNEHLTEIMDSLDSTSPNYADDIYSQLQERYRASLY